MAVPDAMGYDFAVCPLCFKCLSPAFAKFDALAGFARHVYFLSVLFFYPGPSFPLPFTR